MYVSRCPDDETYKKIINTLRQGYVDFEGITRKPNDQVADALVLETNLGIRISDIIRLTTDSFVLDDGIWKICIKEKKTGKKRIFIVPREVKAFVDEIASKNYSPYDNRLFNIGTGNVQKYMRLVTLTLGIKDCGTHGLRKKAASEIYEKSGYDIETVRRFLNHSSVTTSQRYIARSDRRMEQAISDIVNLA